jgi:transposase
MPVQLARTTERHRGTAPSSRPQQSRNPKLRAAKKRRYQPVLSDASWERMKPYITGDGRGRGAVGRDNRMFIEGVLWIARTGAPWRSLPAMFGEWNTVFRRFSRWSRKGIWQTIFEVMADDPDFDYLIIDGIIMPAVQSGLAEQRGALYIKPRDTQQG